MSLCHTDFLTTFLGTGLNKWRECGIQADWSSPHPPGPGGGTPECEQEGRLHTTRNVRHFHVSRNV